MKNAVLCLAALALFVSGCSKEELSFHDRIMRTAVLVLNGQGGGSGTIIQSEYDYSIILTCQHVIEGCEEVTVVYGEDEHVGRVIKADAHKDLALVRIEVGGLPFAAMREDEPEALDEVWLVGAPALFGPLPLRGYITEHEDPIDGLRYLWLVMFNSYGGTSGGGVFDSEGRLFAVQARGISVGWESLQSIAGTIPIDRIEEFLAQEDEPDERIPHEEAAASPEGDGDQAPAEGVEEPEGRMDEDPTY